MSKPKSVDDRVERVRQALYDTGQLDNTLVFFIFDNGKLWAEHGWGDKRVPYTQSIRAPMFATWPGMIAAGVKDTRVAANIDFAPTVLEAVGITPAHVIDGHSLLSSYARARILTEYWHEGRGKPPKWASIRTRTGQYVEYYESGILTFTEFCDLRRDPWQPDNVSEPPRVAGAAGCRPDMCGRHVPITGVVAI